MMSVSHQHRLVMNSWLSVESVAVLTGESTFVTTTFTSLYEGY
jgi:hypothetical protein